MGEGLGLREAEGGEGESGGDGGERSRVGSQAGGCLQPPLI